MSDTSRSASPRQTVNIEVRRYPDVAECDVVVSYRDRQMVLSCPDYACALRWAEVERKSYKVAMQISA